MLSVDIIRQVPALLEQFNEVITTDLSPEQFADPACMIEKVEENKIKIHEIKGPELVSQSGNFGLLPNVEAIKQFIKNALETP